MLEKLANVFRIPDLRKRILFTLGLLAVYRLGGHIPTPGVNADKLQQFFEQNRGSLPRLRRPVFAAASCAARPSSLWASCPTSPRPSFCSC